MKLFFKIVVLCVLQVSGYRRKMLRTAVLALCNEGRELLKEVNIDEMRRPEQLSVQDWTNLANAYEKTFKKM
jgi:16S rRNA A1518/A1519 N6-dimethyltransferase RsmA/KsgA/DIM1 with predicted DNA glycosylase/AP lyase activity